MSHTSITVNGVQFEIEYYLGGDWKFLAMVTGIYQQQASMHVFGANAQLQSGQTQERKWSAVNTELGARTCSGIVEQALWCVQSS